MKPAALLKSSWTRLGLPVVFCVLSTAPFSLPQAGAAPVAVSPIEERRQVCIRGKCFDAEVAVTEAERSRGLMHRESLPPSRGMLFVFPYEAPHRFWMKNTLIELDIIFIGADLRVIEIVHRTRPCSEEPCETYGSAEKVAYVLEIAGGLAAVNRLAAGDLVEFREAAPAR